MRVIDEPNRRSATIRAAIAAIPTTIELILATERTLPSTVDARAVVRCQAGGY